MLELGGIYPIGPRAFKIFMFLITRAVVASSMEVGSLWD